MDEIKRKKTDRAIKNIINILYSFPITDQDRAKVINAIVDLIRVCGTEEK